MSVHVSAKPEKSRKMGRPQPEKPEIMDEIVHFTE
jgi:hypothetical protein